MDLLRPVTGIPLLYFLPNVSLLTLFFIVFIDTSCSPIFFIVFIDTSCSPSQMSSLL
jgi:hypothetical protein